MTMLRLPVIAPAALALALAMASFTGCGKDDSDNPAGGAAAQVGKAEISQDELDEQVEILQRSQPDSTGQEEPSKRGAPLEQVALSVLLRAKALEQEAIGREINVTRAEVRRRWNAASQGQFRTEKELERFLKGQPLHELVDQLRLQILSEKIEAQVASEAGGGKQGERAVKEFQRGFEKRWSERTTCREGQAANLCPR